MPRRKKTRAPYGSGRLSVETLKSGDRRWRWLYYQDGVRKASPRFRSEQAARSWQANRLADPVAPSEPGTFAEAAKPWLDSRASAPRKTRDYRTTLRLHLLPAFGSLPLSKLSTADLNRYIAEREQGVDGNGNRIRVLSRSTLHMHVSMVRSIYEYARATNAYEGRNPADRNSGSQKLRQQPHVRDPKALGRFAQAKLWEAFDEQERPLLAVLLLCGLRFQEASALQWCDFASDHLLVRRFRKADGQLSDVGKSSHASRSIRLSNQVIDILSQHTHYQKARGISVADAALMFPNSKGKIRDVTSFSRGVLARACRQAYIDRITPHQLRHTFVQNQINAGTNVVLLSKLLGHHDPSFTLKVYTNILSFGDPPISEIALDASDARRAAHARNKKRSA